MNKEEFVEQQRADDDGMFLEEHAEVNPEEVEGLLQEAKEQWRKENREGVI
jgi:hypothetical protein